ncbi:hypothetical protein KTJ54_06845 [Acinetobacter radioresistens]|uniref:DNA translocase FtsK n=1 Tax=Acinetobacter radioresistens TaxID=40216 RepID=UPI0021D1B4AD|nr:DNA translocase FtsK [Acinetobacter radioresistens]MCU4621822.1 hypothetical protein [Acinetobacter radioresistens]
MDISEEDYKKAVAVVRKCLSGSVSNLQRKLYWGYGRAASAIDRMQDEFIVSPMSASGRRDVYPEETHELWKELQTAKAQAVPNLIEQLGGYEAAKRWVDENAPDIKWGYLGEYRIELLEYRRQHKIYEVMDRVCLTINIHDESIHDDVLYVTAVCRFGQWVAVNHLYEFSPEKVRHATDEEVKAGKRLEVV